MSLYNAINGVTPAVFIFLPMLGKHPDEYPRFRDCFLRDAEHPEYDGYIQVYTRTGGGNREAYEEEHAMLRAMPGFVTDFDDSFDSTFASWVFEVPECWKADYERIANGDIAGVSSAYRDEIVRVFPKLEKQIKELFKVASTITEPAND